MTYDINNVFVTVKQYPRRKINVYVDAPPRSVLSYNNWVGSKKPDNVSFVTVRQLVEQSKQIAKTSLNPKTLKTIEGAERTYMAEMSMDILHLLVTLLSF